MPPFSGDVCARAVLSQSAPLQGINQHAVTAKPKDTAKHAHARPACAPGGGHMCTHTRVHTHAQAHLACCFITLELSIGSSSLVLLPPPPPAAALAPRAAVAGV